jgi:hypothetical protein
MGLGGVIGEFTQTKDSFYNSLSSGASVANANREAGVRKQQ